MTSSHRITLLPGDGIGPEITAVTRQLLDAVSARHGFELVYDEQPMGGSAIDATGVPLPESTLAACRQSEAVLLAAIGSPQYDNLPREQRPETGLLALRAGLGLFANLRPVKIFPALIDASSLKPEVIAGVDLLVVRELTGGVYFGTPRGRVEADGRVRAFNTRAYFDDEIDRISKVAFDLAAARPLAPLAAGSLVAWVGNLIHWGTCSLPGAASPPRASVGFNFLAQGERLQSSAPLISRDDARAVDLNGRLALIARSVLAYSPWYALADSTVPKEFYAQGEAPATGMKEQVAARESAVALQ